MRCRVPGGAAGVSCFSPTYNNSVYICKHIYQSEAQISLSHEKTLLQAMKKELLTGLVAKFFFYNNVYTKNKINEKIHIT